MGPPVAVELGGQTIWTCCDACPPRVKADPAKYLAQLAAPAQTALPGRPSAAQGRPSAAQEQGVCPVTGSKLGTMGAPVLVEIEGRKVYTCCEACVPRLKAEPARYLARLSAAPSDQVLCVPELAVVDTGTRKLVYVEVARGVFEGREVMLGPRVGDRFPVMGGLKQGEKVAAEGAFLIDAESRIDPATRAEAPSGHELHAAPAEGRASHAAGAHS